MAGIPGKYNLEVVNGVVIGDITRLCVLLNPNGVEHKRTHLTHNESPEQWAFDCIEKLKTKLKAEYNRLGYNAQWDLRVYK